MVVIASHHSIASFFCIWSPSLYKNCTQKSARRRELFFSRPFVGVDGEGGNLPSSQGTLFGQETTHEYLLLRAGDHVLETGQPLTWRDCFGFLSKLPHGLNYVSYFFDYDVSMMVRGLTPERLRRLMSPSKRMSADGKWFPLDVANKHTSTHPSILFSRHNP